MSMYVPENFIYVIDSHSMYESLLGHRLVPLTINPVSEPSVSQALLQISLLYWNVFFKV